jgi:ABC-type proline/glycine betaine transport system substrate-binding protein
MKKNTLLNAALAGLTLGLAAPAVSQAEEAKGEVKCYGVNACGSQAKCGITAADLEAVKTLLGEKEYAQRFGKSAVHSCGSHAKCGAAAQILNWMPTSAADCKAKGGLLIEEGADKKKVAKQA